MCAHICEYYSYHYHGNNDNKNDIDDDDDISQDRAVHVKPLVYTQWHPGVSQ
jgi:hypothetical protein